MKAIPKNNLIFFLHKITRYDFAFLALWLTVFEIRYFPQNFVPITDAMHVFENFYFFYSELFFHGQFAQWMPYGSFGTVSSYYQINSLTPMSYLFFLLGWLFKIKNVLILFKMSLLAEKLILLLGLYLLSRELFSQRSTAFIVSLGAVCSFYCYAQVFFELRMFYMFPLTAYFLVLFFTKRRPEFLWLTGITAIFWWMGAPPYFISLWFFVFCVIGFVFFLYDPKIWRSVFERSRTNILFFGIFVLLLFLYIYQLRTVLSSVSILEGTGRGASGKNSLGMFLTYGGPFEMGKFLSWIVFGPEDISYMGILPLIFLVWALIWVRNKTFLAFLAGTAALLWLSFGGIFAAAVYFFPGMSYYRHISLFFGLTKILLLICAGFGWEHFWSVSLKTKIRSVGIVLAVYVFLMDAFRVSSEKLEYLSMHKEEARGLWTQIDFTSPVFRVAEYGVVLCLILLTILIMHLAQKRNGRGVSSPMVDAVIKAGLIFTFLLDIFSFQSFLYKAVYRMEKDSPLLESLQVSELKFQEQRQKEPVDPRQKRALALITLQGPGWKYSPAYNFVQFDPCRSMFRTDFYSPGIVKLLKLKDVTDKNFEQLSGCETPKLRLISNAVFTRSVEEATKMMRETPVWFDQLVLRETRGRGLTFGDLERQGQAPPQTLTVKGTQTFSSEVINVKKFSANKILIETEVPSENGSWLFYADSFHPGWHAVVNGKKAALYETDLAFKAVHVPSGKSVVRLFFYNGFGSTVSYLIAWIGLLAGMILAGLFLSVFFWGIDDRHLRVIASD